MPEVHLEAFVSSVWSSGSDHQKIACETLADDPAIRTYNNTAVSPSDVPPESYFLSEDAQLEWLSDNAFFDRKDSQRENSGILNSNPNSNPSSRRFLLKSKASVICLPKPQEMCFNEAKQRRQGGKNRVILKRFGSQIKTDTSLLEPSSPKVSCIGRVRSRREYSRRMHRQKSGRFDPVNRVKKSSFLASFRAIFRSRGGCKNASACGTQAPSRSRTHDIRTRLPTEDIEKCGELVVPGLGGMTRFASGRRSDLFGEGY